MNLFLPGESNPGDHAGAHVDKRPMGPGSMGIRIKHRPSREPHRAARLLLKQIGRMALVGLPRHIPSTLSAERTGSDNVSLWHHANRDDLLAPLAGENRLRQCSRLRHDSAILGEDIAKVKRRCKSLLSKDPRSNSEINSMQHGSEKYHLSDCTTSPAVVQRLPVTERSIPND